MTISTLVNPPGPPEYYTREFKQTIEKHLPYIFNGNVSSVEVPNKLDIRYRMDFYGLLDGLNISRQYWWTILRLNGYHNSFEYTGGIAYIIVPIYSVIDELMSAHLAMK